MVSVLLMMPSISLSLRAQTDLPQVFSPNAAELGKYGKVPVSYFNGLPNISIPLTELRAKNYTLPIYLTYHASGNKPDQHPGWVGLGWTLHAGGCINRIVNGRKDERSYEEYASETNSPISTYRPGYFDHMQEVDRTDWKAEGVLACNVLQPLPDQQPDEFQINIDDIQASFYMVGESEIKIVSRTDMDFTVQCFLNDTEKLYSETSYDGSLIVYRGSELSDRKLKAHLYRYIEGFLITNKDGTKYYFGGSQDAIEFSIYQRYSHEAAQIDPQKNKWDAVAQANTWMLTRIERPDGEVITFSYEHNGVPIVRHFMHRTITYYIGRDENNPTGNVDKIYNTFDKVVNNQSRQYVGVSYTFLMPCYLTEIRSVQTGESVRFDTENSNELLETFDEQEFYYHVGNFSNMDISPYDFTYRHMMNENRYRHLMSLEGPRGEVTFLYDNPSCARLRLSGIDIRDSGESTKQHYDMSYDPGSLPRYGARKTDLWGYYNGFPLPETKADTSGIDQKVLRVNPDSLKSSILTRLTYPTGGYTDFEYEPHSYGKVATQFPFLLRNESGVVGGLRIKKLIDTDTEGHSLIRTFQYVEDDGSSSGILAGKPRCRLTGRLSRQTVSISGSIFCHMVPSTAQDVYEMYQETSFTPMSITDGAHVTYSSVRENASDGSYTVYKYSNHDTPGCLDTLSTNAFGGIVNPVLADKYTSHELRRGLLLSKQAYDNQNRKTKEEEYEYEKCYDDHVNTISFYFFGVDTSWYRRNYNKIDASFWALKQKTVTTIPDEGNTQLVESTEFQYDSHRRLTEVKRTSGGVVERDTYSYTGDYTNAPYSGMIQRNMVSLPVEHLHYRKDYQQPEKLVGAELVTWKSSGSYYVPSGKWSAGLGGTGVDAASFTVFSGTGKDSRYGNTPDLSYTHYDANGNLVLSEDRGVRPTTYLWTPDGCRPAAIVPGASVSYVRRDSSNVAKNQVYALTLGQTQIKEFECVAPFTLMLALMCPSGQNWFVEAYVDGERYPMTRINSSYTGGDWSGSGLGQYPFSLQIPLSGGAHSVRVRAGQNYHPDYATDIGCTFIINYREKKVTNTTVPGPTVVFEDFEEDGNHTAEAFRSGKSRKGVWTHALNESFGPYWVDYRVFRNGRWNYVRQSASGSSVTISEGTAPIDHVRIYPMGSLPESYTWWPDGNLRSRTDAQGVTESYRYDGLGRLSGVYDNDGNKVEGYQYNYQNR